MDRQVFNIFLLTMAVVAIVVFVALNFIRVGYGMFSDRKWGPALNNKIAWMLMESPVFFVMLVFWWFSPRRMDLVPLVFLVLFEVHYFRRSFIFPFRIRGNSRMPLVVVLMGVIFNVLNGTIQGEWIFFLSPEGMYAPSWLQSPLFVAGLLLFLLGMFLNVQSDSIIRNLRKPGDRGHYLPEKGLFRYVTSAGYLGEIIEWSGFAIMTWSWAAAIFAIWTAANLVPRANKIHQHYTEIFGEEKMAGRKRLIPFIY